MRTLNLTLKKKWFDMILSGEKKEEYREIKPYWCNRLTTLPSNWKSNDVEQLICEVTDNEFVYFKTYDVVTFKNGYAKNAPTITLKCELIYTGKAKPEWSDNWQGNVFIIKLGNIIKTRFMTTEKPLRKTGSYIVIAKRWSSEQSHNYIVDLCSGIDTAKEIAENEMRERGGKYGMQIIAFREDNNEQEIVFEIESPYKNKVNIPTDNA